MKIFQSILDITTLILIPLAFYALIMTNVQHRYIMSTLIFAYFCYYIKYRWLPSYPLKQKLQIHSLPSISTFEAPDKKDQKNNSVFLQEYQKRSSDKNKRDLISFDKDNSYISYMNRSKKVNQSISDSLKSSSKKNIANGFDFLNNEQNKSGFSLQNSFRRNSKRLNDSYITNMQMSDSTKDIKITQFQKILKQCMQRYWQTLTKTLLLPNKNGKQHMKTSHLKIKKLCLSIVKEFYRENLENIKNIVLAVQQMYEVRVYCHELMELGKIIDVNTNKQDFTLQIKLSQLISMLMSSKTRELPLPERKNKNIEVFNTLKSPDFFISKQNQQVHKVSNSNKTRIRSLMNERIKLNSYFFDQHQNILSAEQLFYHLNLLKEDQIQMTQQYNYESINQFKIQQQLSEKLLLIFNVSRNKINEIVGEHAWSLQFNRKTFMGWIRNQYNDFEVLESVNSDQGHPHYDVRINKQPKQTLYCKYGSQNGYSVLYMYMWALQKRAPQLLRSNSKLTRMIGDCLSLMIF